MSEPRIALVTGASSGIGQAAAVALNAAGWTVVCCARRKDALEETVALMPEGSRGRSRVVCADLAKKEEVRGVFEVVRREYGRLDLLFNVSYSQATTWSPKPPKLNLGFVDADQGIGGDGVNQNAGMNCAKIPMEELDVEADFEAVMRLNVTAVFVCTQEAVRLMKAQGPRGGRIINNASISAYVPRPFSAPYTMSKHAIAGLTKCVALDNREFNIACSQLDIGNAASVMSASKSTTGIRQADGSVRVEPSYDVKFAGDAVVYMASLPLHVNVLNQTLMATNMPFVGRG